MLISWSPEAWLTGRDRACCQPQSHTLKSTRSHFLSIHHLSIVHQISHQWIDPLLMFKLSWANHFPRAMSTKPLACGFWRNSRSKPYHICCLWGIMSGWLHCLSMSIFCSHLTENWPIDYLEIILFRSWKSFTSCLFTFSGLLRSLASPILGCLLCKLFGFDCQFLAFRKLRMHPFLVVWNFNVQSWLKKMVCGPALPCSVWRSPTSPWGAILLLLVIRDWLSK